jgi:hypothetical protein
MRPPAGAAAAMLRRMSGPLHLLYACSRSFDELEGDDPLKRRCSECRLDVVDFRAFTPAERERYLSLADVAQEEVCAVLPAGHDRSGCSEHPDSRSPRRAAADIVGRVDLRSPAQHSWDADRAAVLRDRPDASSATAALAAIEKRAAVARDEMARMLEDARANTKGR